VIDTVRAVHLAQINVGRLLAPVDSPVVAEFMAALEPINALADTSPGFVWRLQTEDGNATSVRPYEDDEILVNLSVWESMEALDAFVYHSEHTAYLRRRREWFGRMAEAMLALWWIPEGELPTVEQGVARLDHLRAHGPTQEAFTFRQRFAAPARRGLAGDVARP
jgi:heme-degrading monooxygenase HmoA